MDALYKENSVKYYIHLQIKFNRMKQMQNAIQN